MSIAAATGGRVGEREEEFLGGDIFREFMGSVYRKSPSDGRRRLK